MADTSNDHAIALAIAQAAALQAMAAYPVAATQDPDVYVPDADEEVDTDDSDYSGGAPKRGRGRGRGRQSGGRGRGRGRGQPAGLPPGVPVGQVVMPGLPQPAAKQDMSGGQQPARKQRAAGRAWTPEEENLFLRAMETFGRDWKKGAELVGTRDHRAIASHAQKYFIKLCLGGKPLPTAVARTGLGYTLSGSPLDPYSAAARSYGFRPELLTRLTPEELQQSLSGLDLDRLPIMYGGKLPNDQAPAPPPPRSAAMGQGGDGGRKPRGAGNVGRKRGRRPAGGGGSSDDDGDGMGTPGMQEANDPAAMAAAAAMQAAQFANMANIANMPPNLLAQIMPLIAAQGLGAPFASSFSALLGGMDPAAGLGALAGAAGLGAPNLGVPGGGGLGGQIPGLTGLFPGGLPGADGMGLAQLAAVAGLGGLDGSSGVAAPDASAQPAAPLSMPPPPTAALPPVQTEYARNRPRRELAGQRAQMGATSESLNLVKPQEFQGSIGSGAPLAQPFTVDMSSWALLAMDFHAHLSSFEVIGLLGGNWNPETRQLVVIEAYACRRKPGSEAADGVELDPVGQVEVQAQMEQKGQKCVGWYHSHPVFEPSPSQKDMDNQRNYQALFKCEQSKLEPFIGLIVGPYDTAMPHPLSMFTAFVVQQYKGTMTPFFVRYNLHGVEVVPDPPTVNSLLGMLDMFKDDPGRTDFGELWRPFSYFTENQTTDGPPLSKLAKFRASLTSWMREADQNQVKALLDMLCDEMQRRWGAPPDGVGGRDAAPGLEDMVAGAGGDPNMAAAMVAAAAAAGGAEGLNPATMAELAAAFAAQNAAVAAAAAGAGVGGDGGGGGMLGLLLADGSDQAAAAAAAGGMTMEQQQAHAQQQQADTADAMAALLPVLAAAAAAGGGGVPGGGAAGGGGGLFSSMLAADDDGGAAAAAAQAAVAMGELPPQDLHALQMQLQQQAEAAQQGGQLPDGAAGYGMAFGADPTGIKQEPLAGVKREVDGGDGTTGAQQQQPAAG